MKHPSVLALFLGLLVPLAAALALAQEGEPAPASEKFSKQLGWEFWMAPYLWFAEIDGEATSGDIEQDIEVEFSDIVDKLSFGLMGRAELWNHDVRPVKLGFTMDFIWSRLEDEKDVVLFEGTPAEQKVEVESDLDFLVADLGIGVRPLDIVLGDDPDTGVRLWLDVLGGGRYTYMKVDADADPGGNVSKSEDFIAPFGGGRVGVGIWRLSVWFRGDVAGFDSGPVENTSWQIVTGVDFRLTDHFSVAAGYRLVDLDAEVERKRGDDLEIDAQLRGPFITGVLHF